MFVTKLGNDDQGHDGALRAFDASLARREAKVPDAGARAPRADAATKPDTGAAAEAEEEPPDPYLFMFDERSVVVRETTLILPDADRFTCSTAHLGEHYDFSWRRTNGTVYIERISGGLEN